MLMTLAALAGTVAFAQNPPPGGGAPGGTKLDQTPLFRSLDANQDQRLTQDEWTAAGLDAGIYGMINSQKKPTLSYEEFNAVAPPETADADKDGKATLDELKTCLVSMPAGGARGPGGAPGGAAPPAGGPPPGTASAPK
ncbi:MAG: hypothetical protein IT480_07385 [Gammaproteobacteria bacterium]|nr:hypothetical protein [Gammaproteobacteria bacterium]